MDNRAFFVLVGLVLAPLAAADEAYVFTDENGVVNYSDRPMPGAQRIELAEPNRGRSLAVPPDAADTADASDLAPFRYESLEVASPGAEDTLWNIEGILNVSLSLSPTLQPGHQVRV